MHERIAPSVRLVGTDELLFRRIMSLLPEDIEVERYRSLDEISILAKPPAFTLYQTQRVNETERQGIERYLQGAPRRLVVLCDQADPPELYRLAMTGAALGLIAVESDRSRDHFEGCLKSWYWGGLIRPDWSAWGASVGEEPPYHVGRMMRMVESDPFSDWRVGELAQSLLISDRTLNRAVQAYFGRSTKTLLMAVRYQLLERAREIGQHTSTQGYIYGNLWAGNSTRFIYSAMINIESPARPSKYATAPGRQAGSSCSLPWRRDS